MDLLNILSEKIDDFKSALNNYHNFGLFFHGTSNPDLKNVVLPPIKTGSISEKNRKKKFK